MYSWFKFPETIDGATSASQLAFELIEQISGVFNKTGTLVKKIAEISDYDEIHQHGDMVSGGIWGQLGTYLTLISADWAAGRGAGRQNCRRCVHWIPTVCW